MKILAVSTLSWVVGLGAYLAALRVVWGETISRGDFRAVVFWSLLAAAAATGIGFAPVMFAVRHRLRAHRAGVWAYPLLGTLLGVLPVVFIMGTWGKDSAPTLLSPEAGLFFCMFAAFGATFGAGFFFSYGRRSV
jgi:hypothetical protein